jgi:peroxiredoxin Q/BCP
MLSVGDRVGAFEGESSTGERVKLDTLKGKPFVVFFYPKSFTPGCTIETRTFAQLYPKFAELGVELVGISIDKLQTQCDFAEKMGASFPIVADPGGEVAAAFGVKKRLLPTYKRVTFVIDEQGVVEKVIPVGFGVGKHPEEVLEYLQSRG